MTRARPPELTFDEAFDLARRAGYPVGFISDCAASEVHFREALIRIWDLEQQVWRLLQRLSAADR